jgi:carbamoyl-phosphate synthase large subunit
LLKRLDLKQPANGIARNMNQARDEAEGRLSRAGAAQFRAGRSGDGDLLRQEQFERFVAEAFIVAQGQPVLIDRFLEDATRSTSTRSATATT